MNDRTQQPHDEADELPPALIRDLAALQRTPRVPAMVEARILQNVDARLRANRRRNRFMLWTGVGGAAAAAVALGVMLFPHRDAHRPTLSLAGDVDRSGRVDILDAFSLARKLRDAHGQPVVPSGVEDVNGDGVIDQKDVDLISAWAVRVTPAAGGKEAR